MLTSKKQVLLTFSLALCSLGLMAGEVERKEKAARAPTAYMAWLGSFLSQLTPAPKRRLPILTLDYPGKLLGFSDNEDEITLTSVGFTSDNKVSVVTYNMNNKKATTVVIDVPRSLNTVLSGNGKILIINQQIVDTTTGKVNSIVELQRSFPRNCEPLLLNHDGTMLVFQSKYENNTTVLFLAHFKIGGQKGYESYSLHALPPNFGDIFDFFNSKRLIKFSRDGKTLACQGPDQKILLFDTGTQELKHTIDPNNEPSLKQASRDLENPLPSNLARITSLDVNHDGSRVAYSRDDQEVVLVNVSTGEKQIIKATTRSFFNRYFTNISDFKEKRDSIIVNFTNTSNHLYTTQGNLIQFWSDTGSLIQELQLTDYNVKEPSNTALSPDDRFLAVGYDDNITIFKELTVFKRNRQESEQKQMQDQSLKNTREIQQELEAKRTLDQNLRKSLEGMKSGSKTGIFARQALRPSSATANVFYQSAMQQALQKTSVPLRTGSSRPVDFESDVNQLAPAVEPLDIVRPF